MLDPDKLHAFTERFMLGHEDKDAGVDMLIAAEVEINRLRKLAEEMRERADYIDSRERIITECEKAGLVMVYKDGLEEFTWSKPTGSR